MDQLKVLDKGFVRLIDTMGGDAGVMEAARVSYAGTSKGEERDRRLIGYLLKHQHLTPFEHAVMKFHVKCPIFVARQWFRHRFAAYNEISYRYTKTADDFYLPETWRAQDNKNRQGSIQTTDLEQSALHQSFNKSIDLAFETYQKMLEAGVAREMARMVLPVNIYTEFYWTVNTRSLMNYLSLRADAHAQFEIQRYAEALARFFAEACPWTYAAFLKHVWKGVNPILNAEKERLCAQPAAVS